VLGAEGGVFGARFRKAQGWRVDPEDGAILDRTAPNAAASSSRLTNLWRMSMLEDGELAVTYHQASRSPVVLEGLARTPSYASVPGPVTSSTEVERACERRASSSWATRIELTPHMSSIEGAHRCAPHAALPVDVDSDHCAGPATLTTRGAPDLTGSDRRRALDAPSCTTNPEAYWVPSHHAALATLTRRARSTAVLVRGDGALYVRVFEVAAGGEGQVTVGKPRDILLSSIAHTHLGFELFHTVTRAGIACASCHPEGSDDGRVWLLERDGTTSPRRTQNLRGGVRGQLHWDGAFEDMSSLLQDVFATRMGGFETTPTDADAVSVWLNALAPDAGVIPSDDDMTRVAHGGRLFEASGCSGCHSGSSFTDHALHETPTRGARKTPTLRGVGLRTRLMSDGSARTVRELLGGREPHGGVTNMAPADLDALSAFVQSL